MSQPIRKAQPLAEKMSRTTAWVDALMQGMEAVASPPVPERAEGHCLAVPRLRRMSTYRHVSLRELRARQSADDLRALYEKQTDTYLSDRLSTSSTTRSSQDSFDQKSKD